MLQAVTFEAISVAVYNSDSSLKDTYEKGYGTALGLTIIKSGDVSYKPGTSVESIASARRAAKVTFQALMDANYSGVVPTTGVTPYAFVVAIQDVVKASGP